MDEPITLEDLPRFLAELRSRAHALLLQEQHAVSRQSMDLVNSVLWRLLPEDGNLRAVTWENPDAFLRYMYKAMAHRLTSYARERMAQKRDARRTDHLEALPWHDLPRALTGDPEQVYMLLEALEQLAERHPEWATVVQHRLWGGLTIDETARVMGTSNSTVDRAWTHATRWLAKEIKGHFKEPRGPSNEKQQTP